MTGAVFFDAAGTLFHLPRGVGWHYRDVAARQGVMLDETRLNIAFRRAWKDAEAPMEIEGPRPDDDRNWWRALVDRVLNDGGAPATMNRDAYFAELWPEFTRSEVWELFPETREVLAALKTRVRLVVVSNFDSRLRPILSGLGIADYFEDVVISSEVGSDKPSPRIFAQALKLVGLPADEVLHVGDEPEADWRGAEHAGLRVFRLQRPENSLRDVLKLV